MTTIFEDKISTESIRCSDNGQNQERCHQTSTYDVLQNSFDSLTTETEYATKEE